MERIIEAIIQTIIMLLNWAYITAKELNSVLFEFLDTISIIHKIGVALAAIIGIIIAIWKRNN